MILIAEVGTFQPVLYPRSSLMGEHRCCDEANLVSVASRAGIVMTIEHPRADS